MVGPAKLCSQNEKIGYISLQPVNEQQAQP